MAEQTPNRAAMIQLYRGELGRMTAYRIRLDTTTNWALGATVAVVTFTLGQPAVPHAIIALPAVLSLVFAVLEARRLQEMEMIRMRVRWLERGFFREQLGAEPMGSWADLLAASLAEPTTPLGLYDALSVRVRRNYIWVFFTLYGAWWFKLSLASEPILKAAHIGPMPGWAVLGAVTAAVVPLTIMARNARALLPG